jgi:hypothetical protein
MILITRAIMEFKWSSALRKSIYAAAEDDDTKEPGTPADDDNASIHSRTGMLSRRRSPVQPFRVWVEPVRGLMSMLEITISYGLMLIAMTFNVGLFFSVVLGVGVGTFVFARYRPLPLRSACCQ